MGFLSIWQISWVLSGRKGHRIEATGYNFNGRNSNVKIEVLVGPELGARPLSVFTCSHDLCM
jgi:hypothetical protein